MSKKYDTFAAYLEDVYYNQIFSKIKSYLFNNKSRLDLSTSVVPDPSYVELSDFKIMGVIFHESDTDRIECKVTVRAEIEISGRGRHDYESDSTECWISIPFAATLRNGLQQVSIGYASEYSRELFRAEDALTKYLVPYIYAKDLDKHAERFLEKYCPRALDEPIPLPIKEIVENMGLTVYHAPLPDGIFGRTYFNDANVEVFTNKACTETAEQTICPGTILVNPDVVFMRNIGSTNNTVIHECVHWDKHYKFFELQKLLNPDIQAISCAVVEDYKKKSNKLEDELSWMEWQANALAPKILIPAKTGKTKLSEILNRLHRAYRGCLRDGYVMGTTNAKMIGGGLDEQLEKFVREHSDTRLIIVDTLQKVREAVSDSYSYSSDYEVIGKLKQFADRYGVCVLIVHHTRKQPAGDSFEMISGTTGLLGCADGALLMQKEKRTDSRATLEVVGRDQPDQRLYLSKDQESLVWGLDHAENELWKQPPDPILEAVAKIVSSENRKWEGSPTELAEAIQTDMAANRLTKHLNVNASRLLEEHQVKYENKTKHAGRRIRLTYMVVEAPAFEVIG